MFTQFKDFYTHLETILPELANQQGRRAFLHRARVAREQEDVETFRLIRNELIDAWSVYLEVVEKRKDDVNMRMSKLLDADVYTSSQDDSTYLSKGYGGPGSSAESPIVLDMQSMRDDGTLLQSNAEHLQQDERSIRILEAKSAAFHAYPQQRMLRQQQAQRRHNTHKSCHQSTESHQQAKTSCTTQVPDATNTPQVQPPPFTSANVPLEARQFTSSSTFSFSTFPSSSPSSSSTASPSTNLSPSTAQSSFTWTPPANPVGLEPGTSYPPPFTQPSLFSDPDALAYNGESSKSAFQGFACAQLGTPTAPQSLIPPTDNTIRHGHTRPGAGPGDPILIPEDEGEYVDVFRDWASGVKMAQRINDDVLMDDASGACRSWMGPQQEVDHVGQMDPKGKGKARAADDQMVWNV